MNAVSAGRFLAGLMAVALLPASVRGDQGLGYTGRPDCQAISPERPYVCDVGEPKPISLRNFRDIAARNDAVRSVVARLGLPDWADLQRVDVEAPWTSYEIRIYYRAFNRMYAFARAFLLDRPEIALVRYQGPIPAGRLVAPPAPARVASAEAEELRAERAAAEAEARAELAERGAGRAEAVADAETRKFRQSLMKH